MYCTNCGAQNSENSKYCHNCGEKLEILQTARNPQQYSGNPFAQEQCSCCPRKQNPACSQLAWHKFLINFWLIVEAIFFAFTAYSYISGTVFGEDRDYIFNHYPDVVRIVKINGYLYLALAVYTIITRNRLAGFKNGAPTGLSLTYVFTAVLAILGNLMMAPDLGPNTVTVGIVFPILDGVFWICVNHSYYKKRAELFVN